MIFITDLHFFIQGYVLLIDSLYIFLFMSCREAIEGIMPAMKESIKEMKAHCYKNLEQQHNRPAEAPVLFVS